MHRKVESELLSVKYSDFPELEKMRSEGWYITHLRTVEGGCVVVLERVTPKCTGFYIPPRKKLRVASAS